MSLKFKPHTVLVKAGSEPVDATTKDVKAPSFAAGYSVACQVMPKDATYVVGRYGIITDNPHQLLCDLEDVEYFSVGDRIIFNGDTFYVQAVRTPATGMIADHCDVLIARNQFEVS